MRVNRRELLYGVAAACAGVEEAAARLGLKTMRLPSGAGHDAQWMARLAPMGMILSRA